MARQVTGEKDNNTAKNKFMKILNNSDMFFNDMTFPPQESNETAFKLCRTSEDAKKNCPKRWKAIQQWFKEAREVGN